MRKFQNIALATVLAVSAVACSKKEKAAGENVASQPAAAKAEAAGAKVDSAARAHLPEGCELVATIDWQKVREMKSVKAKLENELVKLDKPKDGKPVDADTKEFIEFFEKTDINLRTDPTELAACVVGMQKAKGDVPPSFVSIVGGKFRPGAAMDVLDSVTERLKGVIRRAAATADAKKSEPEIVEIAGQKVVHDKTENIFFAQAKDGAFVIGNDRALFEKALGTGKAFEGYKLSKEPIGVALTKAMAPLLAENAAGSPFGDALKTFTSASLGVSEEHVLIDMTLEDEKAITGLKTQLDGLAKQMAAQPGNPFAPALSGAKINAAGKVLTVEIPVPDEAMNGLLQQMGGPLGGPGAMPPGGMPPGATPAAVPAKK